MYLYPEGGDLVEVILVNVPGFSDTEEIRVIVHDKIIQNGCFIVEGTSVMESRLVDVLLCYVWCVMGE